MLRACRANVVVYTCSQSCTPTDPSRASSYVSEYVVVERP